MHAIVPWPRRLDRAGKCQHLVRQQIVIRRRDGIPLFAMLDGVLHKSVEKPTRVSLFRVAADMFQSPSKRKRAPVGLLRPAHMFVPPNCLFEPSHGMQTIEYSVAPHPNQIASKGAGAVELYNWCPRRLTCSGVLAKFEFISRCRLSPKIRKTTLSYIAQEQT